MSNPVHLNRAARLLLISVVALAAAWFALDHRSGGALEPGWAADDSPASIGTSSDSSAGVREEATGDLEVAGQGHDRNASLEPHAPAEAGGELVVELVGRDGAPMADV